MNVQPVVNISCGFANLGVLTIEGPGACWSTTGNSQIYCCHINKKNILDFILPYHEITWLRERWLFQIRWIFKKTKRPSTPPPYFRKIMLQIFNNGYGRIYARRYEGQIVWMKGMHMISRDGDYSEGWSRGWGLTAVWILSENLSYLVAWPVPKKSFTKSHLINLFGFHARLKCSN